MISMKAHGYSVLYKDAKSQECSISVTARSGTHAILVAMEEISFLKFNPNSIVRVSLEHSPDGK